MDDKKKKASNRISKWQTMKRILHYIGRNKGLLVLSFLCSALSVLCTLLIPFNTGEAIDLIVGAGDVDMPAIVRIILNTGILIAWNAFAQWMMNVCNNRIVYMLLSNIRCKAMEKLHRLPFSYLDSHPQGDILSRIISDSEALSDGLLMGFSQAFTGILTIIMALVFMVLIDPLIAVLVLVITPLSIFIANFIGKHTYSMFKEQSEARGEMTSLVNEMVGNKKLVSAFSYGDRAAERFESINGELKRASLRATFYSSIVNPTTRFVNSIVSAVVVLVGAFGVINGSMTVGILSCLISYSNLYTKPFNEISGVIAELQNSFACAARLFELIDEEEETEELSEEASGAEASASCDTVEFCDVSFSYTPEKKLIEHLNLSVKPGQRIAIVGPTGCGKTTLINLIMRFYDVTGGSLRFEGVDVRRMSRSSLRENIGMVLQDTWIRSGTIRENIRFGNPEATDEEVERAAKAAHAHSFIRRLSNGYDTVISEGGGGLSQGQKQLLCISRVMLTLPPVLILDEATSSIDTRTEMKIQQAFSEMMRGRTSFIVAHRLSTIREADVILVMKDGNIIEQGNHEELLRAGGFYKELYMSQEG